MDTEAIGIMIQVYTYPSIVAKDENYHKYFHKVAFLFCVVHKYFHKVTFLFYDVG